MKNILSLPKMPVLRICFLVLSAVVFLMSGAQSSRADETSLLPLGERAFQDMGYAALNAVMAEANRQASGPSTGEPRLRSMTAPHHLILQGNFTPRANNVLLAVFADDGADVSRAEIGADGALGNWVPLVGRLGVGQALPNLAQSFQVIDVPWVANKTYRLRVEYKNIYYTLNTTDIDGLTLFAFNGGGTMTDFLVNVDHLQYRMNGVGEYADVPDPLIVPVGSSVQFRALPSPKGANWPEGKPAWGGSSGADVMAVSNNDEERTRTVTFNTVSTSATDYKTVTAESGNTIPAFIKVISVVIEINLTSAQNDDLVDYRLSPTECRAKVLGNPQTDLAFVLTNSLQHPDRLTFGPTAASTLSLTLSKDGAWSPTFIIWGNGKSENKNDATIEAHLGTTNGAKVGAEDVTVFWYDPSIIVSVSGYYGLENIDSQTKMFTVVTGDGQAVDYAASMGLKPSGLDSSAPQITVWKVGIIQNVSGSNTVRYKSAASDFGWTEPAAATEAAAIAPHDLIAQQSEFIDVTAELPGTYSDSHPVHNPLYNADVHDDPPATRTQTVYLPSIGDVARDSDTPALTGFPTTLFDVPIRVNNVQVGTAKYTFEKATINKSFTTWVALVHQSAIEESFRKGIPKAYLSMARTTWTLNVDSSVAATQNAVIALPVGGIKIRDANNPLQLDPNVPDIPIVTGPPFANDFQSTQDTPSGTVFPHPYP